MIGSFSYPIKEMEVIEAAERIAKADGKSFSDLILRLLKEEVAKKAVGLTNPINISYESNSNKSNASTLDYYLEKGIVTKQHFIKQFKEKDELTLARYRNLCNIITTAANAISYYKKTGRYPSL